MALPLGGTLMMDEDAASIVAQIKNLLGQLRIKGITDKEIDTILTQQQKPYLSSRVCGKSRTLIAHQLYPGSGRCEHGKASVMQTG